MSTHNICFLGEIRQVSVLFSGKKSILSRAMGQCMVDYFTCTCTCVVGNGSS